METTPSPQSVGREFVRQYYTLMNKAPEHLHRFYNNFSSFVHGGMDAHNREATMVIGQKQIYYKIQQLRLHDCHAKISQVDAQSTLGNGVVVQVTGELSNNGEPMRRFTQTFVLAAQSPKKYYVHNDIFRYQDFIADDEAEIESRSENDEEPEQIDAGAGVIVENNNQANNAQPPQQQVFYPMAGNVQPYQQQQQPPQQQQPAQLNGGAQHDEILQNLTPANNVINNNVVTTNGPANNGTPLVGQIQQKPIPVDPLANVSVTPNIVNVTNDTSPLANDIDTKQNDLGTSTVGDNELNDNAVICEQVKDDVIATKPAQNEPKTYAQFFKSDNLNFVSPNNTTGRTSTNNSNTYASRSAAPQQSDSRNDSTPRGGSSRPGQVRERRSSNANQFSDNHQLFLGNVPHNATEDELRVMFSRFGAIADLRIHSKAVQKLPGVRAPQNYGFITYEDSKSVQECLANLVSINKKHYNFIIIFFYFFD